MIAVLQRVKEAKVCVATELISKIAQGIVVFLGIAADDTQGDADFLLRKIVELRIFNDDKEKMNLSLQDIGGELLVVSQFTLLADTRKGRRPSFDQAADPEMARRLYEYFVDQLRRGACKVETGIFGALMEVYLVNDGPVTFILDSKSH